MLHGFLLAGCVAALPALLPGDGSPIVFQAVVHGNTDLIVIGDSQSVYSDNRGQEGLIRSLRPDRWCGRIFNAARESEESGCRVVANPNGMTALDMRMEWPTGDSDGAVYWVPRDYLEASVYEDLADDSYLFQFRSCFDAGDYGGRDIFVDRRVRGWAVHRASAAVERLGSYRLGLFAHGSPGPIAPVEMGLGGGLERSPGVECEHYTVSETQALDLRMLPPAGEDESLAVVQIGGAVIHCIEPDGSRSPGLVLGACARASMDADEWLGMADTGLWAEWFAAVTTRPNQTVVMVMLGHNKELHGDFETNYMELLFRLRDGVTAATGEPPMFLLVAPWASDLPNHMTAERAEFILWLAQEPGQLGEVAAVSLWHHFGGREPPGFTGLHPERDEDLDVVFGALNSEITLGARGPADGLGGPVRRDRRGERKVRW